MAREAEISPEYIAAAVSYDPETGQLFWRNRPDMSKSWNNRFAGRPAFATEGKHGHFCGKINKITMKAHRVVFAILYGRWPSSHIDHKDNNPGNNRPWNIREATRSQNMANRVSRVGTSRYLGVHRFGAKWRASFRSGGRSKHIGLFKEEEDAALAYNLAAVERSEEFCRLNIA